MTPCPTCGSTITTTVDLLHEQTRAVSGRGVMCQMCGTVGPRGKDDKQAEKLWARPTSEWRGLVKS